MAFILDSHQLLCEISQMDLHSGMNNNNAETNVLLFCTLTNPTAGGSPSSTLQGGSREDPGLADHLPMVEASVAAHF